MLNPMSAEIIDVFAHFSSIAGIITVDCSQFAAYSSLLTAHCRPHPPCFAFLNLANCAR
jgi:hypothetical protein